MPSGIIMQSSSVGATEDAIAKVLNDNGYEPDSPPAAEAAAEAEAPKRDDFASDEEFEKAQEEFEEKQEEAEAEREEKEEEEEERKRLEQERRHKPSRRQRAVEKATKDLRDELKKAQERIAALEGGKKPAEAKVEEPKAPKREDFKTDEEFEDAKFDYRYKLRRAKEQAEESQRSIEARHKEVLASYQTRVAAFKEEHDDWEKVVNQPIPIYPGVQLAIIEQENGPQVTYYLGKHPEYTRELAEMSETAAIIAIGRLSDKLKGGAPQTTSEKPKPKPRTNIPEPVKPVSTSAAASTLTSAEAAKKRDYRAFKAAQRRGA